jgi:hypothetical protein
MARELVAVECAWRCLDCGRRTGEGGRLTKVIPASSRKEAAERGSPGSARENVSRDS